MRVELLFSRGAAGLVGALREDGATVEFRVDASDGRARAGSLHIGRVTDVVPGMQAAFVDIGEDRGALLPVAELCSVGVTDAVVPIERRLRAGRHLLVQVERESSDSKGARLTCRVQFVGSYLVLLPFDSRRAVSRRVETREERVRLQALLETLPGPDLGWLARTAAVHATPEALRVEAQRLLQRWSTVAPRAAEPGAPGPVGAAQPPLAEWVLSLLPSGLDAVIVDDEEDERRFAALLAESDPESAERVRLHAGASPLFRESGVEDELQRALRPRCWLPSGGFLTIEETDAVVSIDVNTGKSSGRGAGSAALRTNLEAAAALPGELRRRNLGGLIVVDFVDVPTGDEHQALLTRIAAGLHADPARTRIVELGELGLMQLTRKRSGASLSRALTAPCAICAGTGRRRLDAPTADARRH